MSFHIEDGWEGVIQKGYKKKKGRYNEGFLKSSCSHEFFQSPFYIKNLSVK